MTLDVGAVRTMTVERMVRLVLSDLDLAPPDGTVRSAPIVVGADTTDDAETSARTRRARPARPPRPSADPPHGSGPEPQPGDATGP